MSGTALALHQFRFDQRIFWRNPASVFFTVMLPVVFLVIFNAIFGSEPIEELGINTSTYYVPAIITLAVVSATCQSLAIRLDGRPRERDSQARARHPAAHLGVLRRQGRQRDRGLGADAGAGQRDGVVFYGVESPGTSSPRCS